MGFEIRQIDHVVLYVADVERSVRFYEAVLGCAVARRNERLGMVHLRAGAGMIDLVPRPYGVAGRNVDHVALRIEPWEPEALQAHLAAHGITPGPTQPPSGRRGSAPRSISRIRTATASN
jgi:catechol 2,3-dioxygenase-like lactoylglutathione lyase family enzyme